MNTVKFYIGEVGSYKIYGAEVHVLEHLDCVLTIEGEKEIAFMDDALRKAQKEFIRSDNPYRTLVDISVLEAA